MLKFQRNVFGDKGIWRNLDFRSRGKRKLLAFFLCLSMLTGFLPGFAAKAEEEGRLSDIVEFQSITLHYAGAGGLPEEGAMRILQPCKPLSPAENGAQTAILFAHPATERPLEGDPHSSLRIIADPQELMRDQA